VATRQRGNAGPLALVVPACRPRRPGRRVGHCAGRGGPPDGLRIAIRRRRRDLAILKALGLVPRQVSAAIAWQASAVIIVSVVIGLPLGLAAGRTAWTLVADQLGVVVKPIVPWPLVLILIPSALVLANLIAAGPALVAGRIRPASVLRSE
jgi:ABC-type antimicrobial peptide transport system permease subunit